MWAEVKSDTSFKLPSQPFTDIFFFLLASRSIKSALLSELLNESLTFEAAFKELEKVVFFLLSSLSFSFSNLE